MADEPEKDAPMFEEPTKRIADSVLLLAFARLSMALSLPVLGLVTYFAGGWLEGKFEVQDQKILAQNVASENTAKLTTARVETVERTAQVAIDRSRDVNDRLISVETKLTQESIAAERFQSEVRQRLDRLQESFVNMSNAISALTATLQASQEDRRSRDPPRN